MGRRGRKPDPIKQGQIETKVYLKPENKKYALDRNNPSNGNMSDLINKLIEKDRIENRETQSEGTTVYQVRSERLIKG